MAGARYKRPNDHDDRHRKQNAARNEAMQSKEHNCRNEGDSCDKERHCSADPGLDDLGVGKSPIGLDVARRGALRHGQNSLCRARDDTLVFAQRFRGRKWSNPVSAYFETLDYDLSDFVDQVVA